MLTDISADHPPQGAQVSPQGVHYRVWAPLATLACVQILNADLVPLRRVHLHRSGDHFFHGLDPAGQAGDRYQFSLDDGPLLPDPASRWQPEGVHGPSLVVDPETFAWTDAHWQRPAFRDLVVYELHIGTFTLEGTFRAAIEKLAHVSALGVNAIELMPLGDFAGGRNWGYDGVYLYAPSRAYGHPDDLRALVDAAHHHGLAVILDVVYNHFGPDGNYLHAYIGDYLDEETKTPWGGAIKYGDAAFEPLRSFVARNPRYWMQEFHIDGFRCDATHAIFDASPRHLLQEITASIHEMGGYAIAEDPRNDARLLLPEAEGGFGFDAVWADDFHHAVRVANTHETEGYFGDFTGSMAEIVDTLRQGWLYEGQFSKSENAPRGTPGSHLPPHSFVHCISNHDQTGNHAFGERLAHRLLPKPLLAAEVLLCLSPYTPMLFMGQEWAASTAFLYFTEHNDELGELIRKGRREEFRHFAAFQNPETLDRIPDPQKIATFDASKLNWEEAGIGRHAQSLNLYRTCLALRRESPAFTPLTRENWKVLIAGTGVGVLCYRSEHEEWRVVFDLVGGGKADLSRLPEFSDFGPWRTVLSSSETRFGGDGQSGFHLQTLTSHFSTPETVVLQAPSRR